MEYNINHDKLFEMPQSHLDQFMKISRYINSQRNEKKNDYQGNKYGAFFNNIYGELQLNKEVQDIITHYSYGVGYDSVVGNTRVKKFIQTINTNLYKKDGGGIKKAKGNLNLYYNAWKQHIHPNKISIVGNRLKLDKIYDNSKQKEILSALSHSSNNTTSIVKEEIKSTIESYNRGAQAKSEFARHIELSKKNKGQILKDEYIQGELFSKEEQIPDYGMQRVIVDRPLGYNRKKKSPNDPDMIFDHED